MAAKQEDEEDEGIPVLKSDVLARLDRDERMQELLKSARLRETLRALNAAPDRNAALAAALTDSDFVAVADLMLEIVGYQDHLARPSSSS